MSHVQHVHVRKVNARVQGEGLVMLGEDGGSGGYISCCLQMIWPLLLDQRRTCRGWWKSLAECVLE